MRHPPICGPSPPSRCRPSPGAQPCRARVGSHDTRIIFHGPPSVSRALTPALHVRRHIERRPPAAPAELTVCDAAPFCRRLSWAARSFECTRLRLDHRVALPRASLGHPQVRMRAARAPERALRVAQPPQPSHPPIPHPYAAQRRPHAPSTPRDHTTLGRPRVGRSSKVPFDLAQGRGRRSAAARWRRDGPGRPGECSGTRGGAWGPPEGAFRRFQGGRAGPRKARKA